MYNKLYSFSCFSLVTIVSFGYNSATSTTTPQINKRQAKISLSQDLELTWRRAHATFLERKHRGYYSRSYSAQNTSSYVPKSWIPRRCQIFSYYARKTVAREANALRETRALHLFRVRELVRVALAKWLARDGDQEKKEQNSVALPPPADQREANHARPTAKYKMLNSPSFLDCFSIF